MDMRGNEPIHKENAAKEAMSIVVSRDDKIE